MTAGRPGCLLGIRRCFWRFDFVEILVGVAVQNCRFDIGVEAVDDVPCRLGTNAEPLPDHRERNYLFVPPPVVHEAGTLSHVRVRAADVPFE